MRAAFIYGHDRFDVKTAAGEEGLFDGKRKGEREKEVLILLKFCV